MDRENNSVTSLKHIQKQTLCDSLILQFRLFISKQDDINGS
jgi:hypothetical protein